LLAFTAAMMTKAIWKIGIATSKKKPTNSKHRKNDTTRAIVIVI
jgi:hypothetical protein